MSKKYTVFKFSSIVALFFMAVFLNSCSKNTEDDASIQAKDQIVRVAVTGNVTTLDPQESSATLNAQVFRSIYETLIDTDGSPGLANTWNASENGLEWTINLKQNAYFHNGDLMTAKDVVASFDRIRFSDDSSPFYKSLDYIEKILAIDDLTVKFVFTYNNVDVPLIFADNQFSIMPASLIDAGHNFSVEPIGTGPFQFEEWKDGEKISLSKFLNYHGNPPQIAGVEFYFMSNVTTQVQSLIQGDIDIVPYIIAPELNILSTHLDKIEIAKFPSTTISLIALNTEKPPLDSKIVRQAIAMSIDKDSVISLAYPGGNKINYFWPKNTVYYKDIPEHYDPESAKKIFEKLAQKDKLVITVPENFQPHIRAAELYQAQLAAAGLETEIRKVSWAVWLDQVYNKSQFDLTVIGHTGRLTPYLRLQSFINNGGYVRWHNAEFNALAKALAQSVNEKSRIQIYKKMFELMTNDYPFVYITQLSINIAINSKILGLKFDPILETYDFKNVSVLKE